MKFMEKMELQKGFKKGQHSSTTTAGSDKNQLFRSRLKSNPVWRSNVSHSSKNESSNVDQSNLAVTNSSYIPLKLNEKKTK